MELIILFAIFILIVVITMILYNNMENSKIQPEYILPEVYDDQLMHSPVGHPVLLHNILKPNTDIIVSDHQVLHNPLVEPTRRPPSHVITHYVNNPHFNYPTRGFIDTYSLQGYLVRTSQEYNTRLNTPLNDPEDEVINVRHVSHYDNENKIIKLFGRQKYPNSVEYEYYVMINTGNDSIKYFLENQRKELYDGDKVYIDILKSNYEVKINRDKTFVYNSLF